MRSARAGTILVVGVWLGAVAHGPLWGQTADDARPHMKRGASADDTTFAATGIVRQVDDKTITIECTDTRIVSAKLTASTTYSGPKGKLKAEDIDLGAKVRLSAVEGREQMTASSVELLKAPVTADEDSSKVKEQEDSDAGRPKLHRGAPAARKAGASDDFDVKPATSDEDVAKIAAKGSSGSLEHGGGAAEDGMPRPNPNMSPILQKALEVNANFIAKLPNFVCKQFTTRYVRESKTTGWQAQDVVTASVVYTNGREQYQDIRVGNKKVDATDVADLKDGQTSNGEFGTVLDDLLRHAYVGDFRAVGDEIVRGQSAKIFEFKVNRPSEWRISVPGQTILPGYSGRMWVDKSSGRVVRIERQADEIPEAFPMDTVEQTIDYDWVLIGGSKVLLPSESENLSCQRGTPFCAKNVLEFRNYRQFRGEATIQYEDK